MVYLDEEEQKYKWEHWYMAQIAYEIRAVHCALAGKQPPPVKSFFHPQPKKPLSQKARTMMSKQFWMALVKTGRKKKK